MGVGVSPSESARATATEAGLDESPSASDSKSVSCSLRTKSLVEESEPEARMELVIDEHDGDGHALPPTVVVKSSAKLERLWHGLRNCVSSFWISESTSDVEALL